MRTSLCSRATVRLACACVIMAVTACGHGFSLGGGVARASLGIGESGTARVTPVLSARAFVPDAGKAGGALLSVDVQPLSLQNPLRDETVTPLYILPELQLGKSRFCLRAGIGPSLASWGGNDSAAGVEVTPSAGVSVAADLGRGSRRASLEAYFRAGSGVGEDAVTTKLVGVSVLINLR